METTMKNSTVICPQCRMTMHAIGFQICARDAAGTYFVFGVCRRCLGRLKRLPDAVQNRQLAVAVSQIEKHPERYDYKVFQGRAEAAIYAKLAAELPSPENRSAQS